MTAINNLPNYSGYYQLSKQSGGNVGGSGNATGSLLKSLSSGTGISGSNDAYLLDLSPQAREYLEGLSSGRQPSAPSSNLLGQQTGFLLTQEQQEMIAEILQQHKDAPFTQDTFNQIQNDLQEAGLSPDRLAMLEAAKLYNPTMVLIDTLNGDESAGTETTGVMSDEDKQAKTDIFMQQIVSQWKQMSEESSASADSGDGEQGVGAAGSAGGA